jgi:N-carbamoyl-L-amino-acid hydrolase
VHGRHEAHEGFAFPRAAPASAARRFSRFFFLRWRSLRQRLMGLDPRPMAWAGDPIRSRAVPLQPARAVADLRDLRALTGDENGAQRVAWTDTWVTAKTWLSGLVSPTGAEETVDAAGNQWFTLRGASERAVLIGGHIDSVPNGGWLDGSLNVVAGVEVLRRIAEDGTSPVTVRLVSWADEEGARFGRSLFGSSAASGTMSDQDEIRERTDADGVRWEDALSTHGVDLARALEAHRELETAGAYLELHIEQGPVLESLGLPLGVVLGTFGVERHQITFRGQAAHAGSTPMDQRRDALAAAAKLALEIREIAARTGGGAVCTMGSCVTRPGIVTSVVETCVVLLDQRHLDGKKLAAMLVEAKEASERFAREEDVEVEWERVWRIDPILFDEALIELADEAVTEVAGRSHRLPSGPLHDAAEVARAGVPTVMVFVQSLRGLSHTKLEDTKPEHLELAVEALDRLASATIARLAASEG